MMDRHRLRASAWGLTALTTVALVFVLATALSPTVRAQVLYGSITGIVKDTSAAAIPGADAEILNVATNYRQTAVTNSRGVWVINNVPDGLYRLKVSLTGFKEYVAENVQVSVGNVTRINVTLQVGEITESVTVSSAATSLQTDTTDVRAQLESREIAELPLSNYKNYQSLINLVPGATPGGFQNAVIDTPQRALTTNINGTNRNNNNTRIDGAISVNIWLPHHTRYVPPSETIEVVNISTNNFDAEQGFAGGAATTVITKSGTNQFRGSAFWLHENSALAARDFFLRGDKPTSIRNIGGATLGGPIKKDKLFFFGGFEAQVERLGITRTETVPTMAMRNGDFSAFPNTIYNPFTGNPDGSGRQAFAGNQIPAGMMNPAAVTMLGRIPLPSLPGETANFQRSGTQQYNRYNYDAKIDWYRNDQHRIWGKFSVMDALVSAEQVFGPGGGTGLSTAGSGDGDTLVKVFGVGHNWTLSPTFLVDGNFGISDMHQEVLPPDFDLGNFGQEVLGIPGTNATDDRSCFEGRCNGIPSFFVSGFSGFGGVDGWSPIFRDETSYTFTQNFSWVKKSHEFRWGYDLVKHDLTHWQPEIGSGPRGAFSFSRSITGALLAGDTSSSVGNENSMAAFLLGLPSSFGKSLQWEVMTTREWQHAFYFRDRWQATPDLTFTLGLRYEYFPLISRADRGIEVMNWAAAFNFAPEVLLGGVGGNPSNLVGVSKSLFAPRIGLAYRIGENNVVRAGYGITNNPLPFGRPLRGFFPATIAANFTGANSFDPAGSLTTGIPLFAGPDVSQGALPLPPTVDMRSMPNDRINRGYIQSWNVIYERKLPAEFVASIGYVGTHTVRSLADHNVNWSPPGTGRDGQQLYNAADPNCPNDTLIQCRTATTRYWDGWLDANYHSLQVAVNRRFTGGLFIKAAYTYSKAINFTDDDGWAGLSWNDTSILSRNRARAGYDIPHILQIATLYELPWGQGSGFGNQLIRGWQLNGIFSVNQNRPFTIGASGGSLNSRGNSQTADQVLSEVRNLGGIGSGNPYYDRSAFAPVTDVRYGTSGRNILRGPTWVNLDLSVFRNFRLTEDVTLEFRAESFNISNTPKFNNPNSSVNSSGFFDITSTSGNSSARLWRFGFKFKW